MKKIIKQRFFLSGLIFLVSWGFLIKGFSGINDFDLSKLNPIKIYSGGCCGGGDLVELSVKDAVKYRGSVSTCLIIAYRAVEAASSRLWGEDYPVRGDFKIISYHPCGGSRDVFEFITRAVTRGEGDFKAKDPENQNPNQIGIDNFTFIFTRKSTQDSIKVQVRETVFPDNFFQLRQEAKKPGAGPRVIQEFEQARQKLTIKIIGLSEDKLFNFTKP